MICVIEPERMLDQYCVVPIAPLPGALRTALLQGEIVDVPGDYYSQAIYTYEQIAGRLWRTDYP